MSVKTMLLLLSTMLVCGVAPLYCAEEDSPISVDVEVLQASKYVWRGIVCNNEAVVQPSLTVSHKSGLSFNFWGNLDQTSFADSKDNLSEADYTIGYDWTSQEKDWSVGYAAYTFPGQGVASTKELLASCALGGEWGPTLSVAYDVDQADGIYTNVGWTKTTRLIGRSVNISGGLGYSDSQVSGYYYGVQHSGLSDASLCVEVPSDLRGGWSFTPSIAYSRVLGGSLREAVERPDNYVFGLKLSGAF